jgi:hypothetical protein
MPSGTCEFFGFSLSKDFCPVISSPPSLFGHNNWSCCGGFPPCEYLEQKLPLWFEDPHSKNLPIVHLPLKISVEMQGDGGQPHDCPPPPDLLGLFEPNLPNLPPVVLAGSHQNGR